MTGTEPSVDSGDTLGDIADLGDAIRGAEDAMNGKPNKSVPRQIGEAVASFVVGVATGQLGYLSGVKT